VAVSGKFDKWDASPSFLRPRPTPGVLESRYRQPASAPDRKLKSDDFFTPDKNPLIQVSLDENHTRPRPNTRRRRRRFLRSGGVTQGPEKLSLVIFRCRNRIRYGKGHDGLQPKGLWRERGYSLCPHSRSRGVSVDPTVKAREWPGAHAQELTTVPAISLLAKMRRPKRREPQAARFQGFFVRVDRANPFLDRGIPSA